MCRSQQGSCSLAQYRYDAGMMGKITCLLLFMISVPVFAAAQSATVEATSVSEQDLSIITLLKEKVKANPEGYQVWFQLGVTQAKQRQYNDAIKSFNRVITLQPKLAEPHNNLAVIYNELGDLRAAVKELETSLDLNPGYGTAHENIADLYVKLAAQAYKKALGRNDSVSLRNRYERLLRIHDGGAAPLSVAATRMPKAEISQPVKVVAKSAPVIEPVWQRAPEPMVEEAGSSAHKQVLEAVEAWRSAWSAQDLEAYYVAYDDSFDPGKRFKTIDSWKKYKKSAIRNKKFIRVELKDIVISPQRNGLIKAVMLQNYSSNSYKSEDRKEIIFKSSDAGWKIVHETSM